MKKRLIKMELGRFYDSEYGKLVVRPASVEPKYDGEGDFKCEITKDHPRITVTKAFRDKVVLDKALDGGEVVAVEGRGGKDCSYLEFGVETFENETFKVMGIKLHQEIQRWFLNIYSIDHSTVLYTSQTIEGCLDILEAFLVKNELSLVAVNDFIEKLTTDENLKFIEKITAKPKQNKKEWVHKTLQSIESCEELQHSFVGWLGGIEYKHIGEFLDGFNEVMDKSEELDEVYAYVDGHTHPENIYFFRELERMLEWVNINYDPRCLTDEAIRAINGGLDELAKQCIDKLCKEVGYEGSGGWYLHKTKENENKYLAPYINVSDDVMDFIDDCGYEMFLQNFNSALIKLGYRVDQLVAILHTYDWKTYTPEKSMTFVLEDINPKKAL